LIQQYGPEVGQYEHQLLVVRYLREKDEWTRPVALQRFDGNEYPDISLAGNARGDAVVFWTFDSDENRAIYTAAYDRSSAAWTEPARFTRLGACRGAVALANDGRATAACYYRGRGLSEVNAIRIGDDHTFEAIDSLVSEQEPTFSMPDVLALDDQVLAVWAEDTDLDTTTVRSASFRAGNWQAPELVGRSSGGLPDPRLVAIPHEGVLAYWSTGHAIIASWHP